MSSQLSAAELEIMQHRLHVIATHLFEMQSNQRTLEHHNLFNALCAAHSATELALAAIKTECAKRNLQPLDAIKDIEAL